MYFLFIILTLSYFMAYMNLRHAYRTWHAEALNFVVVGTMNDLKASRWQTIRKGCRPLV